MNKIMNNNAVQAHIAIYCCCSAKKANIVTENLRMSQVYLFRTMNGTKPIQNLQIF